MASGMQTGAQAGAAFGPWGAAAGAGLGMISDIASAPTGPSMSGLGAFDMRSFMDGSGWTVSTGSSKATGGARTQSGDPFGTPFVGSTPSVMQAGAGGEIPQSWLMTGLALAGLAVWRFA